MRRAVIGLALVFAFSAISAGCASRSPSAGGSSKPTIVSSNRPDWRLPSRPASGVVLDLRISVRVDETGQPDMETLKVSGLGASENRDAAAAWVQSARFRPAQQAGQPVDGVFSTRMRMTAQVRRVSNPDL